MQTANEIQVRERAYHIWEQSGRPAGQALEHWVRAEQELKAPAKPKPKKSAAPRKPAKPAARKKAKG